MFKKRIVKIAALLVGCSCIVLVLTASLPGETEGCSTGNAEEVDYVWYCMEQCNIKAWKHVTDCGLVESTEEAIRELCYIQRNCNDPTQSICTPRCEEPSQELCPEGSYWRPYISQNEADRCLEALRNQPCDDVGLTPEECKLVNQCDPK